MNLELLLTLADEDTELEQLHHKHATFPERAELCSILEQLTELEHQRAEIAPKRAAVLANEHRLDDEANSLEARAKDIETRMYSGEITSPKELQAMQADVEQLHRLRSGLDDEELEIITQREILDSQLQELADQATQLEADRAQVSSALAKGEETINADISRGQTARDKIAADIDGALLAEYEKCRLNAPRGAARLVGVTCDGCRLTIPTIEAEQIRHQPPDVIAHCDNCGCILGP